MKSKTNNKTIWYVVVVVVLLNVVAFFSEKSWSSIGILVLASGLTYAVKPDRTLALVAGIIVANLYKATTGVHEGMAGKSSGESSKTQEEEPAPQKKKKSLENKSPAIDLQTLMGGGKDGGLDGMMSRQKELMTNLKNMQPLMAQAQEMMANLPEGFMEKALEKFSKKNS